MSLYDECMKTPKGSQGLAAAEAASEVMKILEDVKDRKGFDNVDIAAATGIPEQRIEEIFNGDGNLHIATVARLLDAMGMMIGFYTIDKEVITMNVNR